MGVKHRDHRKPLRSASKLTNATLTAGENDLALGIVAIAVRYGFLIQPFSAVTTGALQQRVSSMVLTEPVRFGAIREVFDGRVISRVLWSVRSCDLTFCDLSVGNFKR
jgi:hypothetical protein